VEGKRDLILVQVKKKEYLSALLSQLVSLVKRRVLFEVLRTAFSALALGAFRNILQFSAFKQGFHYYLATARTHKFMCCDRCTRVLTGSTHVYSPENKVYEIIFKMGPNVKQKGLGGRKDFIYGLD
jgi:Fe2+ or Zn2+ uptake regulation protein